MRSAAIVSWFLMNAGWGFEVFKLEGKVVF
jgi:hypothetical protein